MKKILTLVFVAGMFVANAQKEISAKTVFDMIDKKQHVEYEGVTILGDLDLTELSNKHLDRDNKWDRNYKSTVEVPLIFRNCTFKGNFIAYKNVKDGKRRGIGNISINWGGNDSETYSTDFNEKVVFESCKFEQDSEFKYSKFAKNASFGGTFFTNQANFKYADFKSGATFSQCNFDMANFKYTNFNTSSDFADVKFRAYADFKYANFDAPVSFNNSDFKAYADFKYADFHKGGNFNQTEFRAASDFKYSNGKRYINN